MTKPIKLTKKERDKINEEMTQSVRDAGYPEEGTIFRVEHNLKKFLEINRRLESEGRETMAIHTEGIADMFLLIIDELKKLRSPYDKV